MLIEFSVANFRSLREKQTLSMVASPRMSRKENVFKPEVNGEKLPALLKVAVIYGPNASGKSNLLKALDVVKRIARREPSTSDISLPVAPFRFDKELVDKPSEFEFHFIHKGVRYQFDFAATSDRIYKERLLGFPGGKEALFYDRRFTGEGEVYEFGPSLGGSAFEGVLETWKKLTPPRLLFIAQAVANSSEEVDVLKAPFEWLRDGSLSILNGMKGMALAAQELAEQHETHAINIAAFLREVDVPISKIKAEAEAVQGSLSSVGVLGQSDEKPRPLRNARLRTTLTHESSLGPADFSYDDESDGTKNLIGFWLPWITKNPTENSRCVLIVDELDSSLHPKIVAALVEKHIHSESPSQLIFTTHDTHLMEAKLLRRDQIWITERDRNGATQLRSVHDFAGREGEDLEKRYYEGRYRGLPILTRR